MVINHLLPGMLRVFTSVPFITAAVIGTECYADKQCWRNTHWHLHARTLWCSEFWSYYLIITCLSIHIAQCAIAFKWSISIFTDVVFTRLIFTFIDIYFHRQRKMISSMGAIYCGPCLPKVVKFSTQYCISLNGGNAPVAVKERGQVPPLPPWFLCLCTTYSTKLLIKSTGPNSCLQLDSL